ncbi:MULTISPECIES: hypothetical protein [Micrococcales]|uniref:hypothetical protein n=1 Tax=Micrococcales TaxID=85006 RepID=UPI003F9B93F5
MQTAKLQPGPVLVIGLSPSKNEEVVDGLRALGIDAVGSTEPDTAAQVHDARDFAVIAFGRAALGPRVERLKRSFADRNPDVRFVDAFGPIAVAQVQAALDEKHGAPDVIENPMLTSRDQAGQVAATVQATCHLTITLYRKSVDQSVSETRLLEANVAPGQLTLSLTEAELADAYSLVLIANHEEYHHLPLL